MFGDRVGKVEIHCKSMSETSADLAKAGGVMDKTAVEELMRSSAKVQYMYAHRLQLYCMYSACTLVRYLYMYLCLYNEISTFVYLHVHVHVLTHIYILYMYMHLLVYTFTCNFLNVLHVHVHVPDNLLYLYVFRLKN